MDIKQNPETLLVLRDGQLDYDYYDLVYEIKRREALAQVGREVVDHLRQTPKKIGQGLLTALIHVAEQAN